ncbi:MAG TPA: hypothetical protein VGO90_15125 [Chthoniobacteraceae bacterium]|jgi:multidrug resistance efflux pump|nr:hypothetical protein [Chthoniobacter sp.]HEV7869018.1 hypothetical protein [Chthoniobacteraceae bacterium]
MRFRLLVLLLLACGPAAAQNELPQRGKGEAPEPEPKLFLRDLADVLPDTDFEKALAARVPAVDVRRAQTELERAERKQQRWQQLAKAGVLAKAEAEAAVLQAARARAKFERARAAEQERELEALRQRGAAGQITPDAVAAAESALKSAQAMAAEAAEGLHRTELLLAQVNLDRQRRLLAAGAGSKNQLRRAEVSLQKLQPATK